MHPSGSLIQTAIEDVRFLLNDATLQAKYDNAYLARTVVPNAVANVYARVVLTMDNPVCIRHQIDLVDGQEHYPIPPTMQMVRRLAKLDADGRLEWDWRPRGEFHPRGPGWTLEQGTLSLRPFPCEDETIHLWYVPSGQVASHYAEDGAANATVDATTFTLSAAPSLGNLGRREHEYAGQVLRVLQGDTHYERVIASYDHATRVCTLRRPIPTLPATSGLAYEVVPAGAAAFWSAVGAAAALRMGTGRRITREHYTNILAEYRSALKTVRDTLSSLQGRTGKAVEKWTIDHPEALVDFDPLE